MTSDEILTRIEVLDLPVDVLDLEALLEKVAALVDRGSATIGYLNIHVANLAAKDPDLTAFLQGLDVCYCDGEGIRLGARILGEKLPVRMTGADWIWPLAERAEGKWRLFWLGGEPGVTAEAASVLQGRHPGLEIDTDHGFHVPGGQEALLGRINGFQPDIVLVGMGTPVQEKWVETWRDRVDAPVVWCLGATADFVAGHVDRGPAILHQNQEWLARLLVDPRRLWKRYLVGNMRFLGRILQTVARGQDSSGTG